MSGRRRTAWALAGLAYAGFVVSAYLTLAHYRGFVTPCYVIHGCEAVQTSRYSTLLGVPVALAGAVYFGLMVYLGVALLRRPPRWLARAARVLSLLGALAVVPLFLVQAVALKAFCGPCLVAEALLLATWIVSLLLTAPDRSGRPLEAGAKEQ